MLARLFGGPLAIACWGIGIWGFVLVCRHLYIEEGSVGLIMALFLPPVSYVIAPLWLGLTHGYWLPALMCYASLAVMLVLAFRDKARAAQEEER